MIGIPRFFDESSNAAYDPAHYPNHAGGIFFVDREIGDTSDTSDNMHAIRRDSILCGAFLHAFLQ